jgi:predicted metal-dependent hydrolase
MPDPGSWITRRKKVSLTEDLEYTVRESPRAKRVRLRVTAADGLVVVVPQGFDRRDVPELVAEHRTWIANALEQIDGHRAERPRTDELPNEIRLAALDRTWQVRWQETSDADVLVEPTGPFGLHVSGRLHDRRACRVALRRWLAERGREHLVPWTEEMAETLGVRLRRITIRCQRTRWGSYSTRGTISLNAQLLFLPHRLARYVILHELCHVVHPNHSPAFWHLMHTHEPESERLRAELRRAWRYVPRWVMDA